MEFIHHHFQLIRIGSSIAGYQFVRFANSSQRKVTSSRLQGQLNAIVHLNLTLSLWLLEQDAKCVQKCTVHMYRSWLSFLLLFFVLIGLSLAPGLYLELIYAVYAYIPWPGFESCTNMPLNKGSIYQERKT